MEESPLIQTYLQSARTEDRLRILQSMRDSKVSLPISLTADLMKLKLNSEEHISILRTTSAKQKLAFEDYLSSQLSSWDQNVASAALWEWATRSDCIMWHRTLPFSLSEHTPQRMRYTLLDLAWFGGGYPLIERIAAMDGIEDMSAAFTSLLCFRALQFGIESQTLLELARKGITGSYQTFSPAEKTLPYFLAYLFRFDTKWVKQQKVHQSFSGIWSQFLNANKEEGRWLEELKVIQEITGRKPKKGDDQALISKWPSLWHRQHVSKEAIHYIFEHMANDKLPAIAEQKWEFFAGIPRDKMSEVLLSCSDPKTLAAAFNTLGSFLDYATQDKVLDRLRTFLQASDQPSVLLTQLTARYSALLNANSSAGSIFARIFEEREQTLTAFGKGQTCERLNLGLWEKELPPQDASRRNYFLTAYHGKVLEELKGDDFWALLSRSWVNPTPDKIDALSHKARQSPDLYQICFIDTLGRFKGNDNAALKLLDFIRSNEEPILRSIMYALQGIGTVRASQELVAFLTRPNISSNLQLEISQLLKDLDVSHLQPELRSALNDLNYRAVTDSLLLELRDAISSLLLIDDQIKPTQVSSNAPSNTPTTADLDKLLTRRISTYETLSSEVKRALRTAQFFHLQVEQVGDELSTIDLSPAIDMQYKALEICFREKFEFPCSEVIRQGVLQRKLDVIGYARPIPSAMDDFENYIESLPIIKSIPFFSRFKLRKMLRAICQYRPGKRFTLDGLKAFAIFFICFSRQECRYGLAKVFPINSMNNEELLNFCKELHIFQDFRNRAAHEGFHPDASHNLESIWQSTATIIQGMERIVEGLEYSRPAPVVRKIG